MEGKEAKKIKALRNQELNDDNPSLEKKNKNEQMLNGNSSSDEPQPKVVGGGLTRTKAVLNLDLEEEKKREELDPNQLPSYGDQGNVKKEGFTVSDHKHSQI